MSSELWWGLLFGSIGLGYVIYGRRQRRTMAFVAGLGLIGLPYLVDGPLWMLGVGAALLALPFVVEV